MMVIERAEPTSGSTFHSAGLVGQLRSSLPLTRMMMHSVDVYRRLESEAEETGARRAGARSARCGSRRPSALEELRRQHGWAKTFGLPMELVSAAEAHERFPLMDPTGVLGGGVAPDRRLSRSQRPHLRIPRGGEGDGASPSRPARG